MSAFTSMFCNRELKLLKKKKEKEIKSVFLGINGLLLMGFSDNTEEAVMYNCSLGGKNYILILTHLLIHWVAQGLLTPLILSSLSW